MSGDFPSANGEAGGEAPKGYTQDQLDAVKRFVHSPWGHLLDYHIVLICFSQYFKDFSFDPYGIVLRTHPGGFIAPAALVGRRVGSAHFPNSVSSFPLFLSPICPSWKLKDCQCSPLVNFV